MNSKGQPLSPEERLRAARIASETAKEKAREKDRLYFESITTGSKWTIFKIFTFYCAALALIITVETFYDGEKVFLTESQRTFYEGAINVDDDWYFPDYVDLTGYLDTTMHIAYSGIFGAPKYLGWTSKYQDSKTPLTYNRFYTWRYNSVYSFFGGIQLILLIPLFLFWFKRPHPVFVFGRMMSLVLIFPASIFLLFVTMGIIDLLPHF